ncbi:cytochrome P450 2D18 [Colletotrichum orchidophilum]|uniref:Cytochrome P450 2D18 n=1 Tax=Colletotrichum orchidophilum TaxID=1209926 RepID=A0A1G4BKZ9_9PEZI|nr:cytochrome P450 2D18 [Colletotrichum orchidophilum]OHF02015.1 cytochrome P450 2D18 [Colletotrichum orchidophilum]
MAVIMTDLPVLGSHLSLIWIIPAVLLSYKILTFGRREKYLPPGPPTLPVLGNAHLIPSRGLYAKFKEWADQYGSIYSLKVGQSTMIVLNDRHAVHELLTSKGAYYNDRPVDQQFQLVMRGENTSLMHDGPLWRAERKIAASYFSPKNLDTALRGVQESEFAYLMHDLLEKPDEFMENVKRTTASIASITIFGQRATDWNSFWAYAVYITMDAVSLILEPGSYLPEEQFPILKLIPDRLAKSRQQGKELYHTITNVWNKAREGVDLRRSKGLMRESLIDKLLDEKIKCDVPLTYTGLNNFLGGLQMAAADTTATATLTNIMLLAKHPEVQEKARVEIDRVCGVERFPNWTDFKDLPYINCIIKEGLRMKPVVPTGVAHASKQDRWYGDMFIPAGSTIFIPAYALNHNSDSSPDPFTYNPERYLSVADKLAPELAASPKYEERDHYSYGAGRRMCVGLHLAERSQWRMVAQMLWAFKIEPALGPDGKQIELDSSPDGYVEGLLHTPKKFKVRFVPRSEKHVEVIRNGFGEVVEFLKQWE